MNLIPAKPVLHRELLVAARSKQTHRLRFFMGLIALVGIAVALVVMSHMTVAAGGGKKLLAAVSVAAYFYCLMMGFSLTLGSIRDERDQGTLSLLFLTSLRGGQIVFAKLFARSLRTFEGLLATLPVFALCLLLGGVTMGEFARVGLAFLNTLFVSACLGMYISAQRLQLAASAFLGTSLAVGLGIVAPFLANVVSDAYRLPSIGWALGGFTPWYPLQFAEDAKQSLGVYWPMLAGSFVTGILFLLLSVRAIRNNWQDKPNQTKKLRRLKEFQNWDFKSASRDPKYRAELLDRNPICWLNCRDRFRSTGYWIFFALIYGVLAFAWALLGHRDSPLPFFWLAVFVFDSGIWAKLNQAAGIQLVEERKLGSLEMILCAPVGLPRILGGLWMALRRQFAPVMLTATCVNLVLTLLITAMHNDSRSMARMAEPATIAWVFVYYTMANISTLIALSWVGMWFGLRNKPDAPMASFGMVRVLVRPWVFAAFLFVFLFILELAGFQIFKHISTVGWVMICSLTIVGSNFMYVLKAKGRIPAAFQLAATGTLDEPLKESGSAPERPVGRRSILARLWRRKILRWVAPVALLALLAVGNRWRLDREYQRRVAALRESGAPVERAHLKTGGLVGGSPAPETPIVKVYQLAAGNRVYQHKDFWRASHRLVSLKPAARESRSDDLPHLAAYVATNAHVLAELRSAMKGGGHDLSLDHYNPWPHHLGLQGLNEKLQWATVLAVHDRQIDKAIDLIALAHDHQRLLDLANVPRTQYYRVDHCSRLLKTLGLLLSTGLLDQGQLAGLQDMLSVLLAGTPEIAVRRVDRFRAYWMEDLRASDPDQLLRAITMRALKQIPPRDRWQFHIQGLFGGTPRLKIRVLDFCEQTRSIVTDPGPARVADLKALRERENGIGLARGGLRQLEVIASRTYRQVFLLRLCQTAVAAERYRLDHDGKYPESVEELYPLYLKTIPVNPVDGKSLLIEAFSTGCRITAEQKSRWIYTGAGGAIQNETFVIER